MVLAMDRTALLPVVAMPAMMGLGPGPVAPVEAGRHRVKMAAIQVMERVARWRPRRRQRRRQKQVKTALVCVSDLVNLWLQIVGVIIISGC